MTHPHATHARILTPLQASYKYTSGDSGKDGAKCLREWPPTSKARIADFVSLPQNETDMKAFVSTMSPFAVGLDAGHPLWFNYVGGIVRSCCYREMEHAPTVIGWGVDEAGGKYWSVGLGRILPWPGGLERLMVCGVWLGHVLFLVYPRHYPSHYC